MPGANLGGVTLQILFLIATAQPAKADQGPPNRSVPIKSVGIEGSPVCNLSVPTSYSTPPMPSTRLHGVSVHDRIRIVSGNEQLRVLVRNNSLGL